MISTSTATNNNNKLLLSEYTKANELIINNDYSKASSDKKKFIRKTSIQPLKRLKISQTDSINKMITTTSNMDMDIQITQQNHNRHLAEEFFYQLHPFSDLILIVEGKEFYVDKSVLSSVSKVFQLYFQDENINSIEIVDVLSNDMIELLQFLYPQFQCTITYQNVTGLLILARRFEINFILTACRTFILLYISKFNCIHTDSNGINLIEQENGLRLTISSILDILCIWYREFFYMNDQLVCENLLNKLSQCNIINFNASKIFNDLEEKLKCKIFQIRAKYLEISRTSIISDVN
ncbi:unnamed protein product [Rotaria sordida]|uniref:BTB domain-containing protein n=1 Tax=Rotaria sordida TaxID=392033 RepID=A0A818ZZ64_9BILA|nr:unnamed protein product [Rotaria sordida]CAF0846254.1 unnamed protein product [Rotaria sordida]CAF0979425.1 unnamed protein product [Rotaria sordida]CAF3588526.1 unnamed protein product [Rotaria sordida]CAF3775830.1 unnamed protein product [Rotaria sordida]